MSALKAYRNRSLAINVLWFYTLISALVSAFEVVRLAGVFNIAQLNKYVSVLVFFPVAYLFVVLMLAQRSRIPPLGWVIVLMVAWGAVFGLLFANDYFYIASDAFTVLLAFFLLIVYSAYSFRSEDLENYLSTAAHLLLWCNILGILAGYAAGMLYGKSVYLSFGGVALLIPFSYFLVYKKYLLLGISCVTVFMSGKVGVMLGAGGIFFVYIAARYGISFFQSFLKMVLYILSGILFAYLFIDLDYISTLGVGQGVIQNIA